MSHLRLVLVLSLALLACACSTSNRGIGNLPDWSEDKQFSVVSEEGLGTFTPQITVSEDSSGATVVINAADAANLEAAYVHLSYDCTRYTPERVEFGSFLGDASQVLSLALTNLADEVPVGIRQIPASGVMPVEGAGVLATVHFRAEPFIAARTVSCSPFAPANAVDDLAIIAQTATTATLRWTEHNVGDYDNNSMVGISDLTPLGALFNQNVASASDPVWAAMVDGDGNGTINIADMTPIGANWGAQLNGYVLYTDNEALEPYGSGLTVERNPFFVNNKTPVVYQFVATVPAAEPIFFSVKPCASDDMEQPGPKSNTALVVIDPGPPAAPTGLTTEVGESIGVGAVKLTWTASTSTDLAAYEVWHKLTSEDDTAWVKLPDVPVLNLTYTATGLSIESHDFRLRARDFTDQLSDWSNVASDTPFTTPPPDPPINVLAVPHSSEGSAIFITWDPPANDSATGYKVYRKAPNENDFTLLATKNNKFDQEHSDTGLSAGDTYEYYITSTAFPLESVPSQTASSQPSEEAAIQIIDLTTDKTTHCTDGSEPDANITVTTDVTPTTVDWQATVGTVTGSGTSVTWGPPGGATPQKVTITCTVHKGSNEDTATIDLFLTQFKIQTQFLGNNIGDPNGSGYYREFTCADLLEPLTSGGNKVSNRPFSWFLDGEHAVLFDRWEIW